jgi:hypothetical protein
MKRRYQIDQQRAVQQFRRLAIEQNPNIQMILPMAEIVRLLQEGVGNLLSFVSYRGDQSNKEDCLQKARMRRGRRRIRFSVRRAPSLRSQRFLGSSQK